MADAVFEPEVKRSLMYLQEMTGGNLPPIAIECKKTMEARLAFDKVKDHQVASLLEFGRIGHVRKLIVSQGFGEHRRFTGDTPFDFLAVGPGYGYLLVNFRFTTKQPRKDIKKGTNRCFGVLAEAYDTAKREALDAGKGSLSYDWFAEFGIECDRIRIKNVKGVAESAWDLRPLVAGWEGWKK